MPALSLGVFAVGPGHSDSQEPHEQDEVYVVAAGQATLVLDDARTTVSAGSIAYVPAGVPHRFVDVTDDLRGDSRGRPHRPARRRRSRAAALEHCGGEREPSA